jgi:hypothetical protein
MIPGDLNARELQKFKDVGEVRAPQDALIREFQKPFASTARSAGTDQELCICL